MRSISVEWRDGQPSGTVEVTNGKLVKIVIARGEGEVRGNQFKFTSAGPCRVELAIEGERLSPAANPTLVSLRVSNPFTVLLRDVSKDYPVLIPGYGVVITDASDARSYEQIVGVIESRGLQTALQRINSEPEETYHIAAHNTRPLRGPIWLGLSRDMRIFEMSPGSEAEEGFTVSPRFHGVNATSPETDGQAVAYEFVPGRGVSCVRKLTRRLEQGVLPILHAAMVDDEVTYNITAFASLESSPLTMQNLRGTHYLVADGHGLGHMFTPEQQAQFDALVPQEINRDEETVFYCRVQAVNTGLVPRYAWFRAPAPAREHQFDGENGFGRYPPDRVFALVKCNGAPLPKEEVSLLLQPGQTATFQIAIPHSPISEARALKLAAQEFVSRHAECARFWQGKLQQAARVKLPEQRIDEMAQAGLLHVDLVAYGLEPDGPITPTIGVYCPIGTESSPMVQYMDSLGWHDVARRALTYFLEKQHDDGFMQNFGDYMLETGAALWSIGEHYRYTRDEAWVRQIEPKLLQACDYMIRWRERNLREELRGNGYGLMEGKVADPEDPYRCYMLNGYAYLGLSRVAEMLAAIDHAEAQRIAREAEALKRDIRSAVFDSMAKSPVVPLGDGTWCPTVGPWAEARGPVSLLTDESNWATHASILVRDSIIGPLYVIFTEVMEPHELASDWLVSYHCDLMHMRNVAFSQPFYSPHPGVHLRREEVKPFLKAYYNGFAGLADRETYSFWEHYFYASPHKTHEEGWFLMQTRWMLYLEQGETLRLLPGVPRAWLENGKRIELNHVASYFGRVSLQVESQLAQDRIVARVECNSDHRPACVELRLPHPLGQKARKAIGGLYDDSTETVRIRPFPGRAEVTLEF